MVTTSCGEMQDQPKAGTLEASAFFADGRASRDLVPGTVARDDAIDETTPARSPYPVTREFLDRGRERYDIFCAACHDRAGDGGGIVVLRGFKRPASFGDAQQRALTDAQVHDAIANGAATMPPFRARIPARDRWAIVLYVRALQLAGNAAVDDVPAADRARLEGERK